MATLMVLFTASGLLLAALNVPLILRKIGPNPLYGFWVKRILEDPTAWYPVNAYAAKRRHPASECRFRTATGSLRFSLKFPANITSRSLVSPPRTVFGLVGAIVNSGREREATKIVYLIPSPSSSRRGCSRPFRL
jgi:hypothetical protein